MPQVEVFILDPTASRKMRVEVPDNVPVQRLIQVLVNKVGLPVVNPGGQPVAYRLTQSHDGQDTVLNSEATLAQAGIRAGDVMRLYADMEGGGEAQANADGFDLDDIKIHAAEVVDRPLQAPPYSRPAEIIVDARAWREMNHHACENLRHEAGGLMLGEIFEHAETTVVRISCAVAAREAINSLTSIQFTYSAWRQMEKQRCEDAATEKLVGWYHTHPGFSAFFSDTDRFMHERFFTQPWHVALVIDPVHGEHRFYRWEAGRVREMTEFLLQVTDWPGLLPPLSTSLSFALRQAARQAAAGPDAGGAVLASALQKLITGLRRSPTASCLEDLLPFMVACSEVDPEAVAEARRRLREDTLPHSLIRRTDLEPASNNANPDGPISIASGWLAQAADRHHVHLHGLEESRPFCSEVTLPVAIRDLGIDERGHLLVLAAEGDPSLYRLEPALPLLRTAARAERRERLVPLEIDWQGRQPEGKIGKILSGRRNLYLLTRSSLLSLVAESRDSPRLRCVSAHGAEVCGWESFASLTSWAVDSLGNLLLLDPEAKKVWRCDALTGAWSQLVADPGLTEPLSLAADMTALSIFDGGGEPAIVQFGVADGRPLCRRPLEPGAVSAVELRHLFSDGYGRLYLVTDRSVLRTL